MEKSGNLEVDDKWQPCCVCSPTSVGKISTCWNRSGTTRSANQDFMQSNRVANLV